MADPASRALVNAWAVYAGSVVVHAGYGWYLSMAVDTIARFRRQRSLTLARRILLPYAVVTLLMNSTFFMQVVVEQGIVRAEPHNPIVKVLAEPCSAGNVLSSILLPLLISMNDTLFLYRAACLFQWRLLPLFFPFCLYIVTLTLGVVSGMSCASSAIEHDATNIEGVWLFLTGILNTLLACMIVWKLVEARRDMLKVGMSDPAAQYISTMSIVIESSGAWVISIILFLASNFSPAGYLQSMSPFFQQLTQIMPMITPALLLHRIAQDIQYTPPEPHDRTVPILSLSTTEWLDQTEKQLVGIEKGRTPMSSSASPTNYWEDSPIQSLPRSFPMERIQHTMVRSASSLDSPQALSSHNWKRSTVINIA